MTASSDTVRVIDSAHSPVLPLVRGAGLAKAVVSPATGAVHRTMNHIRLEAGARTIAFRHAQDAVYYVIAGSGQVSDGTPGQEQHLAEGALVHIDAGDTYMFAAEDAGMTIIGGPCPADASLYVARS